MTRKILLIDDNQDDLFFTQLALKRCDVPCEVTSFERAHDALAWLKTERGQGQHLIILDINMPSITGFEFLELFGRLPSASRSDTSVVILSSSSDPKDRKYAFAFPDVKGYFVKPLSREESVRLVNIVPEESV